MPVQQKTYLAIANVARIMTNLQGPMNLLTKLRRVAGKKMPMVRQIVLGDGRDVYTLVIFDQSIEEYEDALNTEEK